MKNIIVTGASGYVGSILINDLVMNKYNVSCYDDMRYGFNPVIAQLYNYSNFQFDLFDLTRFDDETKWKKIESKIEEADILIHLAALVGYPICEKNPELTKIVNVDLSKKLTDLCKKHNVKMIYSSTGSNYGKLDEICTEKSPVNPLTLYAKTKLEAESYILDHCNSIAFRFATAFGLSPRLRLDLFINDMVYRAISDGSVIIYQPNHKRSFINVTDISRLILHGIEKLSDDHGVYNAGDETMNYTKEEVLLAIKDFIPKFYIAKAEYDSDRDQRDYIVSYEKLKSTGFKCNVNLKDGIQQLINFLRLLDLKQIAIIGFNNQK